MRSLRSCFLCSALVLSSVAGCAAVPGERKELADGARATLAILETTDIHANVLSYDYYKLAEDKTLGFERLATLVREARDEFENTLLFDAGDTIQGTALSDWQARAQPLACEEKLAMYKAMDALGFDGGTIGNHEFNYGLPFLAQVTDTALDVDGVVARRCNGPDFPLVLANVFSARSGAPLFAPTALLERRVKARNASGKTIELPIQIGIIGFVPTQIMLWDKANLDGRVTTLGVVEAARRYAPQLRQQGADVIIAISHGGIDTRPYGPDLENVNWHLAAEPDIDVLLLGHSHQAFPDPENPKSRYNNLAEVDNVRGFLRGKPAVMGNFWGKSLGVIELALVHDANGWRIDADATRAHVRDIRKADGSFVEPDPAISAAIRSEHEATVRYVSAPIGRSDFPMTSYFAAIGDVSALQPVNTAQREFVERLIAQTLPDLRGIPVISAAAPFKVGFGGPTDYTDVASGPLAIRNAADLYLFPNTLSALRIDGGMLRGWLEKSAGYFNRIDASASAPQELINRAFPGYNFDVIQGDIRYEIDITRALGERITRLEYRNRPVTSDDTFILVTNNYRASGGGGFPGASPENLVIESTEMNRDVLIEWVRQRKELVRARDADDRSWRFAATPTVGPVVFTSASGRLDLARAAGFDNVRVVEKDDDGRSTYAIDLAPKR